MGIAMTFGVGSLILLLNPLPADFKIEGTASPPTAAQAPMALALPPAQVDSTPQSPPLRRVAPRVAVGFGEDVPLEFAVRQVAPQWLHVSYGDTVNRHVRVSWQGGRPWNQVLGGVLTPLGLHMKLSGRTLWIRD